jgi:hypothetical protein
LINFKEYIDGKSRKERKQLKTTMRVLEQSGFKVEDFSEEDDPYIFVHSAEASMSFGGVRIYPIAEKLAYRVQKSPETHPYGVAYELDIEAMYTDLLADNVEEEEAAQKVIEGVGLELKKFFEKSKKAERNISANGITPIMARPNTNDYGNSLSGGGRDSR